MTKSTVYENSPSKRQAAKKVGHKCLVSRRNFLIGSGATTATVMVTLNAGTARAKKVPAQVTTYPRKLIGKVSQLKQDKPLDFSYPDKGEYSDCMVVKLGVEAGGGVGKDRDIVAYNYACTHQGNSLSGSYKADTKSLGACSLHLSTYDLTRHGILISGQAYQSLPQILLEVDGDNIYATGVFGLIFGREHNLQS
ncbi:MAG TPA: arsenate reductase (azurin) small subunit [Rhizobiales bacterium]|nr:arsenate reductase (azurin) small subunit [Hyphomicrobiales bacterium]